MGKLIDIARHGIPSKIRGKIWKYLLNVSKPDKVESIKNERKQFQEYNLLDKTTNADIKRNIMQQFLRINQKLELIQQESIQIKIINVISAYTNYNNVDYNPSIIYLLLPFVCILETESEIFWCFDSFMKKIENYFIEDPLTDQLSRFMTYFKAIHSELFNYFEEEELSPNDWAMSWLKTLLAKELPLECVLRLWDTYFSSSDSFNIHIYICLAILVNCSEELQELEISELKAFLQHLPVMDIDKIISQAYNIKEEIKSSNL